MRTIKSVLFLVLNLFAFTCFAEKTPTISQQALLTLMATPTAEALILDVRSPEEFAQGHIKGAVNISHDQIKQNLSKIIDYKDKTVVVHCRSGFRAIRAENALRSAGFSKLQHLEGDMNAWQDANLPLEK